MTIIEQATAQGEKDNMLELKHFDYLELYVGNALQAAHFYRTAFGFTPIARAGLDTKVRDRTSYVLQQGSIRLVLTGAIEPDSEVAEHVRVHGDSVKDIAFEVTDARSVFELALRHGARPVLEPTVFEDDSGKVVKATIAAYGDTVHSFVQRNEYSGVYFPNYRPLNSSAPVVSTGLVEVDHVAVGIDPGHLDEWVEFYKNVLSFHEMHEEMVSTSHSSMNSKVVESPGGQIKFPMQEPAQTSSTRRSQIDEYLSYHHGPGAQHLAFLTNDIISTLRMLRERGIEFLTGTPSAYYDHLQERVGALDAATLAALRELDILVDRDDWGTLMQIFTKPMQNRPTMFIELIQRNGARGFGGGNIKALFEAVEREQALRGNT